jgi:hypothetical protein
VLVLVVLVVMDTRDILLGESVSLQVRGMVATVAMEPMVLMPCIPLAAVIMVVVVATGGTMLMQVGMMRVPVVVVHPSLLEALLVVTSTVAAVATHTPKLSVLALSLNPSLSLRLTLLLPALLPTVVREAVRLAIRWATVTTTMAWEQTQTEEQVMVARLGPPPNPPARGHGGSRVKPTIRLAALLVAMEMRVQVARGGAMVATLAVLMLVLVLVWQRRRRPRVTMTRARGTAVVAKAGTCMTLGIGPAGVVASSGCTRLTRASRLRTWEQRGEGERRPAVPTRARRTTGRRMPTRISAPR